MKIHQAKECFINHHRSGVYAASEAGKEIIYLCSILFDFGFEQDGPTKMYEDSRAVIAMFDIVLSYARYLFHSCNRAAVAP